MMSKARNLFPHQVTADGIVELHVMIWNHDSDRWKEGVYLVLWFTKTTKATQHQGLELAGKITTHTGFRAHAENKFHTLRCWTFATTFLRGHHCVGWLWRHIETLPPLLKQHKHFCWSGKKDVNQKNKTIPGLQYPVFHAVSSRDATINRRNRLIVQNWALRVAVTLAVYILQKTEEHLLLWKCLKTPTQSF